MNDHQRRKQGNIQKVENNSEGSQPASHPSPLRERTDASASTSLASSSEMCSKWALHTLESKTSTSTCRPVNTSPASSSSPAFTPSCSSSSSSPTPTFSTPSASPFPALPTPSDSPPLVSPTYSLYFSSACFPYLFSLLLLLLLYILPLFLLPLRSSSVHMFLLSLLLIWLRQCRNVSTECSRPRLRLVGPPLPF